MRQPHRERTRPRPRRQFESDTRIFGSPAPTGRNHSCDLGRVGQRNEPGGVFMALKPDAAWMLSAQLAVEQRGDEFVIVDLRVPETREYGRPAYLTTTSCSTFLSATRKLTPGCIR